LNKEIPYIGISRVVEDSLNMVKYNGAVSVNSILEVDRHAREFAQKTTI